MKATKKLRHLFYCCGWILLICLYPERPLAQDLLRTYVGTDGGYFKNESEGNLHFSIGEPIVEWIEQDELQLSQGFQQGDLAEFNYVNNFQLFNLFPNPNNGNFNLVVGVSNGASLAIEVYNSLGQLEHSTIFPNLHTEELSIEMALPNQAAGVYFLSFIVDGQRLYAEEFENGPLSDKPLRYYRFSKFVVVP
ncbi:MAG: T9SS type A sorting domain-containing protein [Bacteroidota bacterium]